MDYIGTMLNSKLLISKYLLRAAYSFYSFRFINRVLITEEKICNCRKKDARNVYVCKSTSLTTLVLIRTDRYEETSWQLSQKSRTFVTHRLLCNFFFYSKEFFPIVESKMNFRDLGPEFKFCILAICKTFFKTYMTLSVLFTVSKFKEFFYRNY